MSNDLYRIPNPIHITTTPFRTIALGSYRERRISITESIKAKGVAVDTYANDGRKIGGTIHLFARDLPAFVEAVTAAAAAIGVEIPAPQPDGAALARNLPRARAL